MSEGLIKHRFETQGPVISDCAIREPADKPRELILLLHGYSQSGGSFLKRLEPALPADAYVLAPNGPFPMAERDEARRWKIGFSWYFYDFATDEYYIDMRVSIALIAGIFKQLETPLANLPRRIVGYSQGGYFAPFAAQTIGGVSQVVGMASRFLDEEIQMPTSFRMDVVHGALDDIVPVQSTLESHAKLKASGARGGVEVVEGAGHGIGESMREALRRALAAVDRS